MLSHPRVFGLAAISGCGEDVCGACPACQLLERDKARFIFVGAGRVLTLRPHSPGAIAGAAARAAQRKTPERWPGGLRLRRC